ncbi:hypothetical protein WN48_04398 [Eufriesea mexicana]|nr:hypothetical protein WN48_04398 [Eufriesea mexicana]
MRRKKEEKGCEKKSMNMKIVVRTRREKESGSWQRPRGEEIEAMANALESIERNKIASCDTDWSSLEVNEKLKADLSEAISSRPAICMTYTVPIMGSPMVGNDEICRDKKFRIVTDTSLATLVGAKVASRRGMSISRYKKIDLFNENGGFCSGRFRKLDGRLIFVDGGSGKIADRPVCAYATGYEP